MTGSDHSTVGHRIKERFTPIPSGVKANCKPKTARAPQGQTKKETDEPRSQQASPLFTPIPKVNQSEGARQDQCRGPEADTAGQSELRVAAQKKFLEQPYQQKHSSPKSRKPREPRSSQQDMAECKGVQSVERKHEQADPGKSPKRTYPEQSSKGLLAGQAIGFPGTMLDSRQNHGRNYRGDKTTQLFQHHRPQAAGAEIPRRCHIDR